MPYIDKTELSIGEIRCRTSFNLNKPKGACIEGRQVRRNRAQLDPEVVERMKYPFTPFEFKL